MANYVLKSGANLLKSGNYILTSSDAPPVSGLDINPELWTGFADGEKIETLPNSGGYSQGDINKQGTFATNQISGLPALLFDGVNTLYTPPLAYAARTVFLVVKTVGTMGERGSLFEAVGDVNQWLGSGSAANGSYFEPNAIPTAFGYNANNNRLFVNGNQATPKSLATRSGTYVLLTMDFAERTNDNINIGTIGGRASTSDDRFSGYFARLIIYPKRLTEVQRIAKENELLTYYNL
jgi:hypothetical protein